ncbi:MAG: adenine-specific methyltransferase EcoRI family protein [Candidatus Gracilibacteria bacterium]|nr:adenine-specific methyltransferase EcoRI family protein [Candidatus Gracilibacteria bacterium]
MKKKSGNGNLRKANKAKNDEFYTQLSDIEKELGHYKQHFKGKTIFCNCDDPEESNFWKYFELNFEYLGIKKLVSTHFEDEKPSYKLEIIGDRNHDGKINKLDIIKTPLKQNGDFRSPECIEILKESDIIITNPPFSLFREYVAQLMEYNKTFLIIGNQNALTYKEIFKLIKDDKIWLGYTFPKEFRESNGNMKKFGNIAWYTNLEIQKRYEDLILYKIYNENNYMKYYNFDAINIDKVKEIPLDYSGFMGVPITFLNNYNPKQFEIIGLGISNSGLDIGVKPYSFEHKIYRKEIQKRAAVDGDLYMFINGVVEVPYARVIIKNKKL